MKYTRENQFVHRLLPRVLALVDKKFSAKRAVSYKSSAQDVVSDLDYAVDKLLVGEVSRAFPKDILVTEESSPEQMQEIFDGKHGWIVDPLCGSRNVARGIRWFATNIILCENAHVQAAWVIDHSQKRLLSGVGDKKIYADNKKIPPLGGKSARGTLVEWDTGYLYLMPMPIQKRYTNLFKDFVLANGAGSTRNLGSSLGFAYVATGQLDGVIIMNVYPWDILAGAFLTEQNGGAVTNFDGSPWTIRSKSLIMAGNKKVHQMFMNLAKKHALTRVP